jgi:hypothetical protein
MNNEADAMGEKVERGSVEPGPKIQFPIVLLHRHKIRNLVYSMKL